MSAVEAIRSGIGHVAHPHRAQATSFVEPQIKVTMEQYLVRVQTQPYMMDGCDMPSVKPRIELPDPDDPSNRPKPQGPDFSL